MNDSKDQGEQKQKQRAFSRQSALRGDDEADQPVVRDATAISFDIASTNWIYMIIQLWYK